MARAANGLWHASFALLWQGQLVSSLGDAVYRIALGFWILETTGSTALMGTLLAAPLVTRMLLSPFAGALADRADRRSVLVGSDALAAAAVSAVGIAALLGSLRIWMVLVASVLVGAAGAALHPTIESALPDLVRARELGRANAAMAMGSSGAAILGNAVGGVLFESVGAPLLLLANGLSFALSASSELFLRIPAARGNAEPRAQQQGRAHRGEVRGALRVLWTLPGVRALLVLTGLTHLASSTALVLLVPHFHSSAALGPRTYGFAMAGLAAGALAGYLLGVAKRLGSGVRVRVFIALGMLQAGSLALLPWLDALGAIVVASASAGVAMAVGGTIVTTALQLAVPPAMRGRAFGLRASWMLGLTSAATLGAGALAEWIAPAVLISLSASALLLAVACTWLLPDLQRVITSEAAAG